MHARRLRHRIILPIHNQSDAYAAADCDQLRSRISALAGFKVKLCANVGG
jgi:hypothetical protein